jgi:thioredoxin-like negative regulator of GroEL
MLLVLLAPLIAVAVIGAAYLALTGQSRRQHQLLGRAVEAVSRHDGSGEQPSILFFTGENCTICHTAQKPALDAVTATLDHDVRIREVDIAVQPDLARTYRVMSLPTTIVLNPAGEILAINVGFASAEKLRGQLVRAGVPAAA